MNVHAAAVVADQRLGHEGRCLAEAVGDVLHAILEDLQGIGAFGQGVELGADFALARGGHLVMVHFDFHAHPFHGHAHGGTEILQRVHRRHGEIAALDTRTVADVAFLVGLAGIPVAFGGVDLVGRAAHADTPAHVVEDEKFRFRAEIGGITDAGGGEISLGAFGKRAGIALIALAGGRFDNIAAEDHGGLFEKRVHDRGRGIGHEDHVGFVDTFPARDRRPIKHLTDLKNLGVYRTDRVGDMLFLTARIGKPQVNELDLLVFYHFHDVIC